MNWVVQQVRKALTFLEEVRAELRKSTWPLRAELVESTTVVIISVALLSVYVGVGDGLLAGVIRAILR